MLKAFRFSRDLVDWVMEMVSSPFLSTLLNGSLTSLFLSSRGIRQADAVSPFLFILAVEGLSRLIKAQAGQGRIRGLSLHKSMQNQTHQQFVDDTMLMVHPSVQEVRAFKSYLVSFAKALGLEVNLEKS